MKTRIYPQAKQVDQIDEYHGKKVRDPYRWLEDPDSPETRKWIDQENEITSGFLAQIKTREAIEERLTDLWNYQKCTVPFTEGGKLFYFKNTGLQNQDVLFVRDKETGEERILLDPNKLSEDGTVALSSIDVSQDGKLLAYGISRSGSDWQEWFVRDIETGEDLKDHIKWVKFSSASFTKDGAGFFYSAYDKPDEKTQLQKTNYFQKLYFHKIGEKQDSDTLIYERKDQKEWGFSGSVSEDGDYLVIHVWKGTEPKNRIFYKSLKKPESPVVELLTKADAEYSYVGNQGTTFWFRTDLDAPRGRLIAIDLATFDQAKPEFKELIPESSDTLLAVNATGGVFFASYLKDAFTRVSRHNLDGSIENQVELPGIGTASGFGGKMSAGDTYYSYTSFNTPSTIYKYEIGSGKTSTFFKPAVKFDPDDYKTDQVFVTSKDGTKVPLFITYKKGMQRDGKNPTYLYGYGGFNISMRPAFSVKMLTWMEMGGIYAQACLRGGGEYGEDWHQAGAKLNKQNVFDDFIAAAEWLIDNKYTGKDKLAIAGGSNGGLLVGACMTQRPDLFAAACPAVGVMDMLRFHKFTIGWGWTSDYGSADEEKYFDTLLAYSPLHNLKDGTSYPATLITTADHDDRVVPAHSFKFAAALQKAHHGEAPVLIRIETKAGHGAGKPTSKIIEETSDILAFLTKVLSFEDEALVSMGSTN
ncbi:MAG: S9 family peptidase [Candidatus Melainabacteria bacterium]|nr:S9 family peptidase [Candidatus Melainabacteria bacterium]